MEDPRFHSDDDRHGARPAGDWDPLDPETVRDPYATFARLRRECPVAYSEQWDGFWSLSRYADVVAVAGDARTFINSVQNVVPEVGAGKRIPLHVDPPDHTFYRRILKQPFSSRRGAALEPAIRRLAGALLDPLVARGRGDLVADFTYLLPVQALCLFLNLPLEDAPELKCRSDRFAEALHVGDRATLVVESEALYAYARAQVEQRRMAPLDPAEDVVSALLAARKHGQPLDDGLIVGCLRQLLVAGHLTLTHAIASAVLHLARHPELQERLRRQPARIPDAVEEFLRLYPPNQAFARTATRDVAIGGRTIRAGEPIALLWPAANRDATVFARPDEFDLDRRPNRHLAFGHGPHKCLGAPLARLEMRVSLEELLARTDSFATAGPVVPASWPESGPSALPLRLTARAMPPVKGATG